MEIKSFVFNPFYENTYVLWDESREGIIIDPGCYEKYELEELQNFVSSTEIRIKMILNTHCHVDHVLGNYTLKEHYGCPLWIPEGELEVLKSVTAYAPQLGIQQYTEATPDKLLKVSDAISFGNTVLHSVLVPGHSPGHFMFLHKESKRMIGGDVLFQGSIGRTDLPGGDHDQLLANIKSQVYTLDEDIEVFPGHGPSTTIGQEKRTNPFVKG